jgi:ABC-type uncharacterized transport system permease subunit
MDRLFLVASTFCFLLGFAYSMHALGARVYRPSRLNFFAILAGFLCQTTFLYLRGEQIGRCPLTNFFEFFTFLAWAMVLFYLLIGPTYRLSLLGVFTSPFVLLLQITALLLPGLDKSAPAKSGINPWMELHAAVSIVAYGAFVLAGVAGVMYLIQERQLKTHHLRSIFFHLPPIRELGFANRGLIFTGFILLTVGIGAGFAAGATATAHPTHIAWSICVWMLYGYILAAEQLHRLSPRRGAWLSVAALALVASTLWGIRFIDHTAS